MKKTAQVLIILVILLASVRLVPIACGQGTAFTYQGLLNEGGAPANGVYDLRLVVFDASTNGAAVGGPLTNSAVPVTNGLFVTTMDFGPGLFTGSNLWLRLGVRTNGVGNFTTLSPRQALTPAPYAIFAGGADATGLTGTLPAGSVAGSYSNVVSFTNPSNVFSGSFTGSGAGLTNVWQTSGNTGTLPGPNFLGTVDNQPLELKVNGKRAVRLEPDTTTNLAPNLIAGSHLNNVAAGAVGATIGGGGTAVYNGNPGVNQALGTFNTIGGGVGNTTGSTNGNAFQATVGGGADNTASAISSTIGGGAWNLAYNNDAAIAGGFQNRAAFRAAVAGGQLNLGDGYWAGIGGGYGNNVQTNTELATIAGGYNNAIFGTNLEAGCAIGGGGYNFIDVGCTYSTIAGGIANSIGAGAGGAFIGGGSYNTNTFGGGMIGAGYVNQVHNFDAVVAGGAFNVNSGYRSAIGGGQNNIISNTALYATIPGGYQNTASGNVSLAAGQLAQALHNGAFVWADTQAVPFASTANNQFLIRAAGGVGIGIATPGAQLDVAGGNGNAIRVTGPGGGGAVVSYDLATYYPGTNAPAARILATDDGNWSGGFDFSTKTPGAETNALQSRLHISSIGNVGIGVTATSYQLQLSLDSAGKPSGGSWANSSDRRLKQKIQPLVGALDKLTRLRGVTFEWIHPEAHADQTGRQGGFIAQEVATIFPSWVTEVPAAGEDQRLTSDGKVKSLSLPFEFDALVVEAIKEQQRTIRQQDEELATLRRELEVQRTANRQVETRLETVEKALGRLSELLAESTTPPN